MKYIIIGLGNYGHVLAEELSALGHEVIGADISAGRVDSLKDKVATAFVIDATDGQALSVLPLNSVDVVIVAIGENFGASIRVVALLKQKKVKRIYARAIDGVHRSVLEAFGLDRILTPEEDAARGLVHLLEFGADIETFRVDSNYYVVNFTVPEKFIGYNVNELKLDSEFGLKLLALKRAETLKNCLGISFTEHDVVNELPDDDRIQAGDRLVCYGRYRDSRSSGKRCDGRRNYYSLFCSFYCLSGKIAVSLLPNARLFRHGVNSIPPWWNRTFSVVEQNLPRGGTI